MMTAEENMRLMQTLGNAWNSQDWETFKKRHAQNVAVYRLRQPEPTRGRGAHFREAVEFFKVSDNRLSTTRTRFSLVKVITPVQLPTGQQL
jgi:hypothetical protein